MRRNPSPSPPPAALDSVVAALAIIGDRWTLLILREAFFGVRRFGDMQRNLGVARTVLSARLKTLVTEGLLERVPYRRDPVWYEYRLTAKGKDLWPAVVTLLQWGDRHLQDGAPPIRLRHLLCDEVAGAELVCAGCHAPLQPQDARPERDAPEPAPDGVRPKRGSRPR